MLIPCIQRSVILSKCLQSKVCQLHTLQRLASSVTAAVCLSPARKSHVLQTSGFQVARTFLRGKSTSAVEVEKEPDVHSKYEVNIDLNGMTPTEYLKNLEGEDARKLKVIKLEYEMALASGQHVPQEMTDELWLLIWKCPGRNQRKDKFRYIARTERLKAKKERLKEENKVKESERLTKETREEGGFTYPLMSKNTFMLRLLDKAMNMSHSRRIYEALQFGDKIIFDMSFDSYMRPFDITNTVDQILEAHGVNKSYPEPFYIYFCNANPDGKFVKRFDRSTCGEYRKYPFTVTEKSYLDLFPREELVYLTPNAPNYLEEYDRNATYIIGGLVDKVVTKPVTMAKAKKEGVKMAKLPLDIHMRFVTGNKSLCLNQILGIMCEIKKTGSWRDAFKYVPRRKAVFTDEVEEFQKRYEKQYMRNQKHLAKFY